MKHLSRRRDRSPLTNDISRSSNTRRHIFCKKKKKKEVEGEHAAAFRFQLPLRLLLFRPLAFRVLIIPTFSSLVSPLKEYPRGQTQTLGRF